MPANIHVYLERADTSGAKVEILDADNRVVRTYEAGKDNFVLRPGLNRIVWDRRTDALNRVAGPYFFGSTNGYQVPVGEYTVRLSAGGKTQSQPLRLLADPRLQMTAEEIAAQQQMLARLHARANEIFATVRTLRDVRDQVAKSTRLASGPNADSARRLGTVIQARIDSLEPTLVQSRTTNNQDVINYRGALIDQVIWLTNQLDASGVRPTAPMIEHAAEVESRWNVISARVGRTLEDDVARLNTLLAGQPAIVVPNRARPVP